MAFDVREYIVNTEDLLPDISYYVGSSSSILERGEGKRRSGLINVFPSAPYLSLISKLVRP